MGVRWVDEWIEKKINVVLRYAIPLYHQLDYSRRGYTHTLL